MMLFILIPLYCALSAFIVVICIGYLLLRSAKGKLLLRGWLQKWMGKGKVDELFDSLIDSSLVEREAEAMVDQKLDDLVVVFKQQIPMASTFLVGSLADKLKNSAKVELMKILPDARQRFKESLRNQGFESFFIAKFVEDLTWPHCRSQVIRIALIACAIGALLGVIQVGWMYCIHAV